LHFKKTSAFKRSSANAPYRSATMAADASRQRKDPFDDADVRGIGLYQDICGQELPVCAILFHFPATI